MRSDLVAQGQVRSWKPPGMVTAQPLWKTCSTTGLTLWWESLLVHPGWTLCVSNYDYFCFSHHALLWKACFCLLGYRFVGPARLLLGPLKLSLLRDEHVQLPQFLLTRKVLQPLTVLVAVLYTCSSLSMSCTGGTKLDTASRNGVTNAEQRAIIIPFELPAVLLSIRCSTLAGLLCCKGSRGAHAQLTVCQPLQALQQSCSPARIITRWSPFPRVGLSIFPCWIPWGPCGPFLQPVQVPLDSSSALGPVDCLLQFGVIFKLGIVFPLPPIFLLSKFI